MLKYNDDDDRWGGARVCKRFNITSTTLNRWRKGAGFPEPLTVCGRNYYRVGDVLSWEAEQIKKADPANRPVKPHFAGRASASANTA